MKNLYVVKRQSKKENARAYFMLYADYGYAQRTLTFEPNDIAEFIEKPVAYLYALELDKPVLVAEYKLVKGE